MMNRYLALCYTFAFLVCAMHSSGQGSIGIGTTVPNASAVLDIHSTSKGVLIPRVSTSQRMVIATPAEGLIVYDSDLKVIMHYDGSAWVSSSLIVPSMISDADGDTKVQTEESLNDNVIRFDVAGAEFATMDGKTFGIGAPDSSLFIGFGAGYNDNGAENDNTFVGARAGHHNVSGAENTAMGSRALEFNTGSQNTGIGFEALRSNTLGVINTALGNRALHQNTTGSSNIAVGNAALLQNVDGASNIAVGVGAMESNTSGSSNVAIGLAALYSNTTGGRNIGIGRDALLNNTTGNRNIAIGDSAMSSMTSGLNNIALGVRALENNEDGGQNVAIGRFALWYGTGFSNNTAIGDQSQVYTTDAGHSDWGHRNTSVGAVSMWFNTFGYDNTGVGFEALKWGSSGARNAALGSQALGNNNGYDNTAVGMQAMYLHRTGDHNTAIGVGAMRNDTSGNRNIAIGSNALSWANDRDDIVAIGDSALYNNGYGALIASHGTENTAVGARALKSNGVGLGNTAIGFEASRSSDGSYNTVLGAGAAYSSTEGGSNTLIGYETDYFNTTSLSNVMIGYQAGKGTAPHAKSGNVFIGRQAGFSETGSNKLYIENSAAADPLLYGEFDNNIFRVNGELQIGSSYWFPTADGSTGQVLMTNGTGQLSWGASAILQDADADTHIGFVEGAEDEIVFTIDNKTSVVIDSVRIHMVNGSNNYVVGRAAGDSLTTGNENAIFGGYSGHSLSTGSRNSFVGNGSGWSTAGGYNNAFVGFRTGFYNTVGLENTYLGAYAGEFPDSSEHNTYVGFKAGRAGYGSNNTCIGYEAGSICSGGHNTLVGYSAGLKNLGGGNTAVGSFAMYDMNDGSSNTAVGRLALNNSIDGSSNVAVGTNAMASDTSGSWNVAIGLNALFEQINADDNVAIGPRAMHDNLTGSKNVVMGTWAMRSDTTGDRNVAIGYESGGTTSAVNRSGSVFLGYRAGYHESNSDRLYIANSSSSSPLIYGEFDNDLFRVHGTFSVSDASGSSEYLTVTPNGELILSATSGDEMTIINDNEWTWGGSSLNFGDGGDHFIIASRESSTESAGIYGDGNNLTLWSPGDQAPGQPSALLYLLDEDLFADANSDPYDNGALKAYVSQTGVWTVSDRRKKNAIKPMDNSLTKVLRMQGYTYQYNQEDEEVRKSTPSKEVAGLMAQELEQIFPQAVDRNDAGEYFVNTNMLIPVLVEAIKEQQHSIQELRDQNERLHAQLGSIADQLKDNQGQID